MISASGSMSAIPPHTDSLVTRSDLRLYPDYRRVIARPFLPGQEFLIQGISRVESVLERILDMDDEQVHSTLASTVDHFRDRHASLLAIFRRHFDLVSHRLPLLHVTVEELDQHRQDLIGAYFTQEYAIEGAALFNPSIVAHPDQSGLGTGEVRFVMSARAVGEGHISMVEFRTGILTSNYEILLDPPGDHLSAGTACSIPMSRDLLAEALSHQGDALPFESVLHLLPERFTPEDLELVLHLSEADVPHTIAHDQLFERIRRAASASTCLTFDPATDLSERVILPMSASDSHGMEDARFVRFVDDVFSVEQPSFEASSRDDHVTYFATYTAFDGEHVAPQMLKTRDFIRFEVQPMIGIAAQNKGMALFPRRINGEYWAISRWDRENISVTFSPDALRWEQPVVVQTPYHAWEMVQLGACTSPMETAAGWLVLTHGVGPMRVYAIGALLLDLDDPGLVIGQLDAPLLSPQGDEREGYVPNVIYSCGALIHGDRIVLPYGCSDASIRFAFIDLGGLLELLTGPNQAEGSRRLITQSN